MDGDAGWTGGCTAGGSGPVAADGGGRSMMWLGRLRRRRSGG